MCCYQDISEQYAALVDNVRVCAESPGAEPLKDATNQLADPCSELVRACAVVQSNPNDPFSRRELSDHAKGVAQGVHAILQVFWAGGVYRGFMYRTGDHNRY